MPDVPAPPATIPMTPETSDVAAMIAFEGAPVSLASLLTVVPVVVSLVISESTALAEPRFRFAPNVPVIVGLAMVGPVARTTAPPPVTPLDRSLAAGCAAEGTPEVEIALMNLLDCATND